MERMAECVVEARDILGEGPKWSGREAALHWLDVTGKKLKRYEPASGKSSERGIAYGATSFAFMSDGNLLLNYLRGPKIWSPNAGDVRSLDLSGISPDERFNDNRCDKFGRCWTGTYHRGLKEPLGHLYCIHADGRIVAKDDGIMMSNGIAWSPDHKTLYYCDSWPGRIYAYDFDADDAAVGPRRVLADLSATGGRPDGCVMDADGCLWVAEVDLWRIGRYRPDGRLDMTIAVPVRKPTSVTFGGPDLKTLFITSRRSGLSEDELQAQPLAGGLFAIDVPVGGLPEVDYAGRTAPGMAG